MNTNEYNTHEERIHGPFAICDVCNGTNTVTEYDYDYSYEVTCPHCFDGVTTPEKYNEQFGVVGPTGCEDIWKWTHETYIVFSPVIPHNDYTYEYR